MRVLLIKTSSMGDIIHTLPALTDAGIAIPDVEFDWVVEDTFAEVPSFHPLVGEVVPVALRRWRKEMFSRKTRAEWRALQKRLSAHRYDVILDAQGLVKSACLTWFAKGRRVGLDWGSAREGLASLAYQRKCTVNFYQHAVVRMRSLFSQAFGYALPGTAPDFGLNRSQFQQSENKEQYLVFLHGTTWASKQWPESYWMQLADLASQSGYRIKMSGSTAEEIERAGRIAKHCAAVDVIPSPTILEMARLLGYAKASVAVDTGFGHLAAALNVPTVSLYGPTCPQYTGAIGKSSAHLTASFQCAPCFSRTCKYQKSSPITPACYGMIPPMRVWEVVKKKIRNVA